MSSGTVFLVGQGLIALLLAIVFFLPDSWLGRELRRTYQVQTTGASGRFAASDFLHAALMSFVVAALLIGAWMAAFAVSFRQRGTLALVLEGYSFGFFLLGVVVFLTVFRSLWRALQVRRADRRVAVIKAANEDMFAQVRDVVWRHNVMGLEGQGTDAEVVYEAARLLGSLLEAHNYEELVAAVHALHVAWFSVELVGPPEQFAALSQELWNLRAVPGRERSK
jgi:hypothetical protein